MAEILAIKVVGLKDGYIEYVDDTDPDAPVIAHQDVPFINGFDTTNSTTEITFEGDNTTEKVFSDNELSGTIKHDKLSPALLKKMYKGKRLYSGGVTDTIKDPIVVTAPGSSYETTPTVTIAAPDDSDGVQATAHAVMLANAVSKVLVDEPGKGYTSAHPAVSFSGGGGSGAAATASLADLPVGVDSRLIVGDNSEFANVPVGIVATAACIVELDDGTSEKRDMIVTIPKANMSPLELGGLANRAKESFSYKWTAVKTRLDIVGAIIVGTPSDGLTALLDISE